MKRVIAIILCLMSIASILFAGLVVTKPTTQYILLAIAVGLFIASIVFFIWSFERTEKVGVQRLVLINGDGEREIEWIMGEASSLLIGKSNPNHYVDIDLIENRYSSFVASSHAVLNRIGSDWYIEDLDTINGIGIKKSGTDFNFRIQPYMPHKVDIGDIIYIAKIRLLVR